MSDIWFISDPHFGHDNIIKFIGLDGQPVRPGFKDIQHMDMTIVNNWNSTVKPGDKVYCLGDFGNPNFAKLLHGKKRLILGNHDVKLPQLMEVFQKISLIRWWNIDGISFVCSHCPIRFDADSLPRRQVQFNVHGHIHEKSVWLEDKPDTLDLRYVNLCVEHTNYTPVHIDDLVKIMKNRMKNPFFRDTIYQGKR